MKLQYAYYLIKPMLPRFVQIALRRRLAQYRLSRAGDVWPVLESAARLPEGWTGWPENKRFAFILIHDIKTARGQTRCLDLMRLEQDLGFVSSFNFVPEHYTVDPGVQARLLRQGFEVGVHGLNHNGRLYQSRTEFTKRAEKINDYIRLWQAKGFRSPSMHHNLEWIKDLEIEYDASTFDTDPFEPQADGVGTIFPFMVMRGDGTGYVELPYTLAQDFTLFVLLREKNIDIWKKKLDWIAKNGGMALVNTHPDYMCFDGNPGLEEYPVQYYQDLLDYVQDRYAGQYWHVLPREVAGFWRGRKSHV